MRASRTDAELLPLLREMYERQGVSLRTCVRVLKTSRERVTALLGIVTNDYERKARAALDPVRIGNCRACGLSIFAGDSGHECIVNRNIYEMSAAVGGAHELPRGWRVL